MSAALRQPAIALAFALGLVPLDAGAQVLEIGGDGAVTLYDRPAIFTADGVEPIGPFREKRGGRSSRSTPSQTLAALASAADAASVSADLVEAVAWQESRLLSGRVSRAGAVGEMQLMPATARALGVNPYDTRENFRGGAVYLATLLRRYDGDVVRSLAAYNAGPGAVDRYGGVPPYKETQTYVSAILNRLSARVVSTVKLSAQ